MLHLPTTARGHRRGNYTMTMGAFLPVLIGFAALSVDISYVNMARSQSQHVADAASHAALIAFRSEGSNAQGESAGEAAAEYIVEQTRIGDAPGQLELVEFGQWNFNNTNPVFEPAGFPRNAARAVVSRSDAGGNALDLFFAPLLGVNKASVAGIGVTAGMSREIMLVHDVSGSFAQAIFTARQASADFVQYFMDNPQPGDRIGMTVFGGRCPSGCGGQEQYQGNNFPVYQPMRSVLAEGNAIKAKILNLQIADNMNSTDNPRNTSGWTSQWRGINQAVAVLNDSNNPTAFQGIVVVSDGVPTCHATGCGNDSAYKTGGRTLGSNAAISAWEDHGIHVWSLYYTGTANINDPSWQVPWMTDANYNGGRGLPKGLGKGYQTPDANQLSGILLEIASQIPVVLTH